MDPLAVRSMLERCVTSRCVRKWGRGMGLLAFVSDIHANIEALVVVVDDIEAKGIAPEDVICLGDVIGYGPNPAECLDIALHFRATILGNHEEAVVNGAFGFSPMARQAINWTRAQFKPRHFGSAQRKQRWDWLAELPYAYRDEEHGLYFVHGSPRDPTMEYVQKSDCEGFFGEVPPKLREIFGMIECPCLIGHTHVPCVIHEDATYESSADLDNQITLEPNTKYVINVGSVGQPRDQDTRACYCTYDTETRVLRWHRLEYDVEKTAAKIRELPMLDNRSADRLTMGM